MLRSLVLFGLAYWVGSQLCMVLIGQWQDPWLRFLEGLLGRTAWLENLIVFGGGATALAWVLSKSDRLSNAVEHGCLLAAILNLGVIPSVVIIAFSGTKISSFGDLLGQIVAIILSLLVGLAFVLGLSGCYMGVRALARRHAQKNPDSTGGSNLRKPAVLAYLLLTLLCLANLASPKLNSYVLREVLPLYFPNNGAPSATPTPS